MKSMIILAAGVITAAGVVGSAQADTDHKWLDRVEDRLDRRESIRDERYDRGPRDVIEDRIDRRESRRDRLGKPTSPVVNRWERRSIRARLGRY